MTIEVLELCVNACGLFSCFLWQKEFAPFSFALKFCDLVIMTDNTFVYVHQSCEIVSNFTSRVLC